MHYGSARTAITFLRYYTHNVLSLAYSAGRWQCRWQLAGGALAVHLLALGTGTACNVIYCVCAPHAQFSVASFHRAQLQILFSRQ